MSEVLRDNVAMQRREAWEPDGWIACIDVEALRSLQDERTAPLRYGQGRTWLMARWKPERAFGSFPAPPKL